MCNSFWSPASFRARACVTIDKAAAMKWFVRAIETNAKVFELLSFRRDTADTDTLATHIRALATACIIYPTPPGLSAFIKATELDAFASSCTKCQGRGPPPSDLIVGISSV